MHETRSGDASERTLSLFLFRIPVVGMYWPHAESVSSTTSHRGEKVLKDLNRRTERTQKSPWPQAIDPQIDMREQPLPCFELVARKNNNYIMSQEDKTLKIDIYIFFGFIGTMIRRI